MLHHQSVDLHVVLFLYIFWSPFVFCRKISDIYLSLYLFIDIYLFIVYISLKQNPEKSQMAENNLVPANLREKVKEIMACHHNGVTQKVILSAVPDLKCAEDLLEVLRALLSKEEIIVVKKGNQVAYKLKTGGSSKKVAIGDVEEKMVYESVKRAGNNGVAPKDLKFACNLPQLQITKILKALETRKLVKVVVSKTKRKLYMLPEFQPNTTVTGGVFYNNEEFDSELASVLGDLCYKFLLQAKAIADKLHDPILQRRASFKSSKEIFDYIIGIKISKVDLKMLDIENILESLIYDNKIEKCLKLTKSSISKSDSENYYGIKKSMLSNVGLMRMPCGVCLVYQECGQGRAISPSTCEYMKDWLDF